MISTELTRIKEATAVLKNGGIIVYPTETVYGIGCDPFNMDAYEKVRGLKKRLDNKSYLLLASSLSQVEECAGELEAIPRRLADVFWPGPLTMVIKPSNQVPAYLLGVSNGIAFRVTSHPVAASLAREFGHPIISTSANITGQSPIITYEKALSVFGDRADLVIENSERLQGTPSTVIDLTSHYPQILREGSIPQSQIEEVLAYDVS